MQVPKLFTAISITSSVTLIAIGVLIAGTFSTSLEATNSTEFCTSCHSMQWVKAEWQQSIHYTNASGVRAECRDCHVPHQLFPKLQAKLFAAKDVWHEILGTIDSEEKFIQHRWTMANRVWDKMIATDSRECRSCHTAAAMDLAEQTRSARKKHKRAEAKGTTCIECHHGVAHEEPQDPSI